MDLTLIEQEEHGAYCYKLLRATFYRDHYVIIAQGKRDFACASFCSKQARALEFFRTVAETETEPYTLSDIVSDLQKSESAVISM